MKFLCFEKMDVLSAEDFLDLGNNSNRSKNNYRTFFNCNFFLVIRDAGIRILIH